MDKIDLKVLLENGENRSVKIRKCFNSETVKTLSAFANTSGGRIIIDAGECVDNNRQSLMIEGWIDDINKRTKPALSLDLCTEKIGAKTYILLTVDESSDLPVSCEGSYYFRKSDSDIKMDINEIINRFD